MDIQVVIPKIIMQTWKNNDIPDKWKPSVESIKQHMPSWKYVLMTDDDNYAFVKKYFPDFLSYYERFEYPIQRADAIRYMWLYVNGGIYIDLDIKLLSPLDHLFTDGNLFLVSSGNIGSVITNSFMASKPQHPIWIKMIEAMKKPLPWWAYGKHIKVMNSTGPVMLNYVVKKSTYPYVALPTKLLMPCSVCDIKCNKDDALVQPLEGCSWISYDTMFYNYFMCNWRSVVIAIIILLLLLFILLILWYYKWI